MTFSMTEIILISLQIILIPFARYVLTNYKKEIISDVLKIINEHYISLESLIDRNKDSIDRLADKINHRAEIVAIKNKMLEARVIDVENFLQKHEKYQVRCRFPSDDQVENSDFST